MPVARITKIENLIASIVASPVNCGSTRVVSIDGRGGAGKSTFSRILASSLSARIVETDDFASWENPFNWWPRLTEQVLEPLSQHRSARYQRHDWIARRLGDWIEFPPVDFLVLEGVSSSRAEFRGYLSFSIWIETPRETCLARGIERDGEAMRDQWIAWMAEEDEYIARDSPQEHADLVISGELNATYDPNLEVVVLDG